VLVPALCALVFVPGLASVFIVPKAALMVASAAIALVVIGFCHQSQQAISIRDPLSLILTAGVFWICLITTVSPLKYMAPSSATMLAAAILLFVCSLGMGAATQHLLFRSLAFAAVLISAVAVSQFAFDFDLMKMFGNSSTQAGRMRVIGTLGNPNFAGEFLAACLPAVLCLRNKAARCVSFALVSAAVLCTGSRAAVLAAFVSILLWILLDRECKQRSRRVAVAITLLALVAALWMAAHQNPRSLRTALQGRATIWRIALHETRFFGTGLGTFSYIYLPAVGNAMRSGMPVNLSFITPERHAQNDLVEIIVETGPIGGVLALFFVALWFRRALSLGNECTRFAVATVAAILSASMFDFPFHRAETLSLFAVAAALPFGARESSVPAKRLNWLRPVGALVLGATLFALAALSVVSGRLAKLGADAENAGRHRVAATYYSRAASLWPDNTDAAFAEARALAQAERYSEALAAVARTKRYIAEPELYLLHARILESMNDHVSAEREMESAAKTFPFSTIPQSELQEIRSNKRP
jgi:O-antigen ligase